ncbi:MAG: HlyD family efflux transporter periplasmic adaptor subunit [Alphaproteobacteria bacterium]|nr:HlyD family efflux transporter periplasmic adaptor subunit [Alphaproteobacteria bacterium]
MRYSPVKLIYLAALLSLAVQMDIPIAEAQSFNRAAKVETKEAISQKIAPRTQIQGRVKTGPLEIVTAPASGRVQLEAIRIGDIVVKGQKLAEQDSENLQYQLRLLRLRKQETEQNIAQLKADIEFEKQLGLVAQEKLTLLEAKLARAEKLRASQTISSEAFDTTKTAYLAAREQTLLRARTLARLRSENNSASLTARKLLLELEELEADIAKANILTPVAGQIAQLAGANALYMREGEEIARIRTDKGFEVEADIPADYVAFLSSEDIIEAVIETQAQNTRSRSQIIQLKLRAILPTQNSRTSTRPTRFLPLTPLPDLARAENTALTLQIPTKSPQDLVTIPQDALVPLNGGYVVFVAKEGRAEQRIVTLGGTVQDKIVILKGIVAGEAVITKGNEILSDGKEIVDGNSPRKNQSKDQRKDQSKGQSKNQSK